MCRDRRRHYDDGFMRVVADLIRGGAGRRSLARRLGVPVSTAGKWVEHGLTKAEVMEKYRIAGPTPLERWCREYRSGGPDALRPKPKGRPKGAKSKPRPAPTREQLLEEENAYLKARVAYLEKVDALLAWRSATGTER